MFRIKNKRTRSLRARLRAGCLDIYIYIALSPSFVLGVVSRDV